FGKRDRGNGKRGLTLVSRFPFLVSRLPAVRRLLVIAKALEDRLAQQSLVRPFLVPHLDDERRLDPGVTLVRRDRTLERRLRAHALLERRADGFQLCRREPAPRTARIHELAALVGAQIERAESGTRALGPREPNDDEVVRPVRA